MLRKPLSILLALVAGATATTAAFAATQRIGLDGVKHATAKYQHVDVATTDGYATLLDANGIACIDMPGMGAMGTHHVNGDLVKDPALDPDHPEALVYETDAHGHDHLVALEYIVFQSDWDPGHASRPQLFGQSFSLTPVGNRFGLPAFYSLHVWAWKHSPAGTFAMWNPQVTCSPGAHGSDDHGHEGAGGHGPHIGGRVAVR